MSITQFAYCHRMYKVIFYHNHVIVANLSVPVSDDKSITHPYKPFRISIDCRFISYVADGGPALEQLRFQHEQKIEALKKSHENEINKMKVDNEEGCVRKMELLQDAMRDEIAEVK